jgi:hypothetical protein
MEHRENQDRFPALTVVPFVAAHSAVVAVVGGGVEEPAGELVQFGDESGVVAGAAASVGLDEEESSQWVQGAKEIVEPVRDCASADFPGAVKAGDAGAVAIGAEAVHGGAGSAAGVGDEARPAAAHELQQLLRHHG